MDKQAADKPLMTQEADGNSLLVRSWYVLGWFYTWQAPSFAYNRKLAVWKFKISGYLLWQRKLLGKGCSQIDNAN